MAALLTGISCSEQEALTDPIYFEEINSDQMYLGGSQLLIPAYAEIYNTAFLNVPCLVANEWYPVRGPTTNEGLLLGFVDNGFGGLTYTDITRDRRCLISTSMTVSLPPADRPAIVNAMLFVNGVGDQASMVGEYISDADPGESVPLSSLVTLQPGDFMEIYVSSPTANVTVIVNTLTFIATTVD